MQMLTALRPFSRIDIHHSFVFAAASGTGSASSSSGGTAAAVVVSYCFRFFRVIIVTWPVVMMVKFIKCILSALLGLESFIVRIFGMIISVRYFYCPCITYQLTS